MKSTLITAAMLVFAGWTGIASAQNNPIRETSSSSESPLILTTAMNPKDAKVYAVVVSDGSIVKTSDAGATWSESNAGTSNASGSWLFSGKKGTLFSFVLENDGFSAYESSDIGDSWKSLGTLVLDNIEGKPSLAFQEDGQVYLSYVRNTDCQREVVFMQSKNSKKWSDPAVLNKGGLACNEGDISAADITIGLQGYIYALWLQKNKIVMDRSFDEGSLWLSSDVEFKTVSIGAEFGRPQIAADRSPGRLQGSLYATWEDNTEDKVRVLAARSSNNGDFWTPTVPVSYDGNSMFPKLQVDQSNGITYIGYWSEAGPDAYDIYLAFSIDGAQTFKSVKINDAPVVNKKEFLPGALSVNVLNNRIFIAWYEYENGEATVYTRISSYSEISVAESSD